MNRKEIIKSICDTGCIPANEVCPFRAECAIAQGGECRHFGRSHKVPFSCGAARSFPEVIKGGESKRTRWEELVYSSIEELLEVSRSDAQGIARDELLDHAWVQSYDVMETAEYIIEKTKVA